MPARSDTSCLLSRRRPPSSIAYLRAQRTVTRMLRLLISMVGPLLVGGLSGLATARSVTTWYPTLAKPPFNPPAWVFGPAWTLLYLMMGVALYLVWREGWQRPDVRAAMLLFAAQLVLNGLWSVLFFGLRSPALAFAEILVLWAAIGATAAAFRSIAPAAALLMLPYLAWVSFAAVLNGSIWWLNR
jgi:benzodiazapine receptor